MLLASGMVLEKCLVILTCIIRLYIQIQYIIHSHSSHVCFAICISAVHDMVILVHIHYKSSF